ncbi:MAG: enoyl-CoA hydratase/isomerase family protein [Candidatus Cloacimonetes bacterium]|nr:enoyl-CoA hydratase/isomerase family protein [Candidatus Cloacimonadota bacterium]
MKYLLLKEDDNILWVTMNREEVHNAFNALLIDELLEVFTSISDNIKAVVLTAKGRSFSAGADLNWMKEMINYSEEQNKKDSLKLFDMVYAIKSCPVPVIGRINGSALGGGAGLVSACDISLGIKKAKFGFTEVKLGLLPAAISPFVNSKIGATECSRYFLTGERFDGSSAKTMGLLSEAYDSVEELDQELLKIVDHFKQNAPNAMKNSKALIAHLNENFYQHRDHVANAIAKARVSKEGQEGLGAFLQKRPANFS